MLGYQMCSCCKLSLALWLVAAAGVGSSKLQMESCELRGKKIDTNFPFSGGLKHLPKAVL